MGNNESIFGEPLSIKDIGEIRFRRSYAGHEHWSDSYLDSIFTTNPSLDILDTTNIEAFNILTKEGFVVGNDLIIDKLSEQLQDTLLLVDDNRETITITVEFDSVLGSRIVQALKAKTKYKIPFDAHGIGNERLKKIIMPNGSVQFLALSYWYFMNGDMFSLHLFELE
jgi:hypothetical protein